MLDWAIRRFVGPHFSYLYRKAAFSALKVAEEKVFFNT